MTEHLGQQISIKGFSGVGLTGAQRHPKDTDERLCLTLYGQDGVMQELIVPRSRDAEMFQEWLRRYDRYTPRDASAMSAFGQDPQGLEAKPASAVGDSRDAQGPSA